VLDGDLFLVRHLFILKEITHSLDLVQKADASSSSMSAEMAGVAGGGMTGMYMHFGKQRDVA
jgi:hypothetical protein